MKKALLNLLLVLAVGVVSAQNVILIQADSRLQEVFNQEQLTQMKQTNPDLILYYNLYLTQSYEITELPYKPESIDLYPSLPIPDDISADKINILLYEFELKPEGTTLFRWGKTNKLLKFKSMNDFNLLYDAARKAAGLLK